MILYLYGKSMQVAALKNPKAKLWVECRKNTFQYLEENVSESDDIIWIHTPSLGEFEQARPLIQILKKEYIHYKILITFYSPSGYEVRKNYPLADYVCYLPLDTKVNAQRFVKLIKPVYTFFVKYIAINNFRIIYFSYFSNKFSSFKKISKVKN